MFKIRSKKKRKPIELKPLPTNCQSVFLLSKANGASYLGDHLPVNKWTWDWPTGTWLQDRREKLRTQGGENGPTNILANRK